jgi:deazaflavin-dependent oxidoreductase (nitroreductase family)
METLFGREHVDRYVATDGAEGYDWRGTTILILTTTGRRTGEQRTHALIYRDWALPDGTAAHLIVGSKGGADAPPAWYVNLQAEPRVHVQVKGDRFAAHARTATPAEKPAMWAHMLEVWPDYAAYQAKTEREIPIVVLERD